MEWHELPKYNGIQFSQLIYTKRFCRDIEGLKKLHPIHKFCCFNHNMGEHVDIMKEMSLLSASYLPAQEIKVLVEVTLSEIIFQTYQVSYILVMSSK